MASLYIANASTASTAFQVNGLAIFPGSPFAPGPNPPGTPYFSTAPITTTPGPGGVSFGENTLSASFSDQQKPNDPYTFAFVFPARASVDDDLIAYAFRGALLLMTREGRPLPPNPFPIMALPAPA